MRAVWVVVSRCMYLMGAIFTIAWTSAALARPEIPTAAAAPEPPIFAIEAAITAVTTLLLAIGAQLFAMDARKEDDHG